MTDNNYYSDEFYQGTGVEFLKIMAPNMRGCKRILDYGCGNGKFLEVLKDDNMIAEGYDPLAQAVKLCKNKGLKVNSVRPDWTRYDGLTMISVIEHMELREIEDILKNYQGRLLIQTSDPRIFYVKPFISPISKISSFWDDFQHIKPYTPIALKRLLIFYGFRIIKEDVIFVPRHSKKLWKNFILQGMNVFSRLKLHLLKKVWGITHPYFILAEK